MRRLAVWVMMAPLLVATVAHAQPPPQFAFAQSPQVVLAQPMPIEAKQGPADPVGAAGAGADVSATGTGVPWASLSAAQKQLLGRLQDRWDTLPPLRQQTLARGAARWLAMTPQQRASARGRFQMWQRLPPGQRAAIRQRWRQFLLLPPAQQRAVLQNFRAFSRLPPRERAALRQRWQSATPQERRNMLLQLHRARPPGVAQFGRGRRER